MATKPLDWREENFTNISGGSKDMAIDGSGADVTFRVAAPTGKLWIADTLILMIQDGTGWNSGDFAKISNGLDTGIRFRKRDLSDAINLWSYVVKNNVELDERLPLRSVIDYANGQTVAVYALELQGDIGFHITDNEVLEIIVRDNLESLTKMRAHIHYGVPE